MEPENTEQVERPREKHTERKGQAEESWRKGKEKSKG